MSRIIALEYEKSQNGLAAAFCGENASICLQKLYNLQRPPPLPVASPKRIDVDSEATIKKDEPSQHNKNGIDLNAMRIIVFENDMPSERIRNHACTLYSSHLYTSGEKSKFT